MKRLTTVILVLLTGSLFSQAPGDDLFATDQIIKVELQFAQTGFWDSLVANYTTETYMQADVTITDNSGVSTFQDIGIRLKGNSSYGHPGDKKSFKIDFNRYVDSLDYDKLEKLNFNNCFKDPTFMREKIIYDICRNELMPAPRCIYADVYMNGTYWGFYDVVEQIDDDFLNTHFDNSSENLFKAGAAFGVGSYYADLMYYGTDTTAYENRYALENNATENDWTDLIKLTDFINNSSDVDFADSLQYYFNEPVLMKSLVIDNLFSNLDSYTNSARNYYIYHNPVNGLWEWIKWDCNEAFGSYPAGGGMGGGVTDMTMLAVDYYALSRPLLERIVTIAATRATYDYYYCDIKNKYFTDAYIDAAVITLDALIRTAVLADDNKMYTDDQYIDNLDGNITAGGGPGGGTIYGLRSFVAARNSYLDGVVDCTQIGQDISPVSLFSVSVYPNPTTDVININLDKLDNYQIQIYNINGTLIAEQLINGSNSNFDLQLFPAGMYLVKVSNSTNTIIAPVIKN